MLSCLIRSKNERAAILTIRMHYDHVDTPVFSHRGRKKPFPSSLQTLSTDTTPWPTATPAALGAKSGKMCMGYLLPTHGTIHCINIHKLVYTNLHTCRYIFIYDGLSKCLFPVLLINRNSMRAASRLPLKNITYLDDVKTWKFFVTFGNLSKTTGIG